MTITTDTQVEFDGFELFGEAFEIQSIEGLADMPPLRTGDILIAGRDGVRQGMDYLDARTITISTVIHAATRTDFAAAVRAFRAAFQPTRNTDGALRFQLSGIADDGIARINCRPRAMSLPMVSDWWAGFAEAAVQLVAADPLIYSDELQSFTTTLPSAGGGLTFDATFDLVFGSVAVGGAIAAENVGTWPADALIRIDGPAVNPRVENVTAGKAIELDLAIGVGEFLLIDTMARTVLLAGTASRYSSLTDDSEWWQLQPGSNDITFRATTDTAATLTVAWRSAWI